MIRGIESVQIGSQNAAKLAAFYKDKVGLKITVQAEMGEKGEEFYELRVGKGSPNLYIMDSSKVKGKSKQKDRIFVNFEVDDIKKESARLKKAKVKQVNAIYHVEGYGYVSTFEDLDGNIFQLAQVRA